MRLSQIQGLGCWGLGLYEGSESCDVRVIHVTGYVLKAARQHAMLKLIQGVASVGVFRREVRGFSFL